jgi:hypothetical protein
MPSPENLFGMIVFGSIGLAAWVYGRKSGQPKPMIIGAGLVLYSYFVSSTLLLYGIGAALTAALFIFRD